MQFSEIIGQEKAKANFLDAFKMGRLPHAILLPGAPGIGKLAFANAVAQYVNCEDPGETDSCGKCHSCSKIRKGIHPDVRYILPVISSTAENKKTLTEDFFHLFRESFFPNPYLSFGEWTSMLGGENKQLGIRIPEIRELKRKIVLKAFEGKYKVVIIWNAEKINSEAANAMLKLLEEPPERTLIMMTVSDPTRLLTTINSRCQRLRLNRVSDEALTGYLVEKHDMDASHAAQVVQLAEGSVTRAIELMKESEKSFSELYMNWLRTCLKGQFDEIQQWVDGIAKENREFQKLFLGYALQKTRDTLLFSFNMPAIAASLESERDFQQKFSKYISANGIETLNRLLEDSMFYLTRNGNPQMVHTVLSLRIHSLLNGKVLI